MEASFRSLPSRLPDSVINKVAVFADECTAHVGTVVKASSGLKDLELMMYDV